MAVKVGINGFGRIGRNIMRAALGDKNDDVRFIELGAEKRGVAVLGLRRRGDEAVRVEVVVRTDEERAEPADGLEVRGRHGADENVGHAHND